METDAPPVEAPLPLSKKQQRRLRKAASVDREGRRLRRREDRRRSRQRAKSRLLEGLALAEAGGHCVEELRMLGKMPPKPTRDPEHRDILIRAQSGELAESLRICIDLRWLEFMTPKEIQSLSRQLRFAYSANLRAVVPANFWITSAGGPNWETMASQDITSGSWLANITHLDYQQAFGHSPLPKLGEESKEESSGAPGLHQVFWDPLARLGTDAKLRALSKARERPLASDSSPPVAAPAVGSAEDPQEPSALAEGGVPRPRYRWNTRPHPVIGPASPEAAARLQERDRRNWPPKLVYLTSESPNEIDELDPETVYIIGGIVDHNRLKGITHKHALEEGIPTARLPLDKHLQQTASNAKKVLSVNHVFELLLMKGQPSHAELMARVKRQAESRPVPAAGAAEMGAEAEGAQRSETPPQAAAMELRTWPEVFETVLPQRFSWTRKRKADEFEEGQRDQEGRPPQDSDSEDSQGWEDPSARSTGDGSHLGATNN